MGIFQPLHSYDCGTNKNPPLGCAVCLSDDTQFATLIEPKVLEIFIEKSVYRISGCTIVSAEVCESNKEKNYFAVHLSTFACYAYVAL